MAGDIIVSIGVGLGAFIGLLIAFNFPKILRWFEKKIPFDKKIQSFEDKTKNKVKGLFIRKP